MAGIRDGALNWRAHRMQGIELWSHGNEKMTFPPGCPTTAILNMTHSRHSCEIHSRAPSGTLGNRVVLNLDQILPFTEDWCKGCIGHLWLMNTYDILWLYTVYTPLLTRLLHLFALRILNAIGSHRRDSSRRPRYVKACKRAIADYIFKAPEDHQIMER